MLRKTAVSLAVAGILSATQAHALSIGDIRVKSALNEPLDAEIHLTDTKGLKPLQIRPSMADIDEFALAGLSKSQFLSDIKFAIQLSKDGTGKLRMTSSLPVQEAFLNFLVEVNWPNGRLVREYTVLLDPPVFDPTPGQQTQPSLARGSSPAGEGRAGRGSNAGQSGRITVDDRDTLWALAIKHRVARNISSQQMMMALQKKNPNAFRNNNINQLKRGSVLRLPTQQEAREMTTREAIAEIARQTAAWKAGRQVAVQKAPAAAPVDVSKKTTAPVKAPEKPAQEKPKADQLKIVSAPPQVAEDKSAKPEAKTDGAVSDQSAPDSAAFKELTQRNTELEQQLASTLEDVDRIERANADMTERLDAIQQQLDALQRMLELKDQQLAAMQAELQETKALIPPPPPVEPPEKSLLEKLSSPLYWGSALGALVLAVLGGAFAFWRRRKNAEEEQQQDELLEPASAGLVQVPDQLETEGAEDELSIDDDDDGTDQISDEALDAMEDLDEMSDLDLDMDLDLDPDSLDEDLLAVDEVDNSIPTVDELGGEIKDEEFDLGIEDPLDGLDLDVDQPAGGDDGIQEAAPVDPDDLDLMLDSGDLDLDEDPLAIAENGELDAVEADVLDVAESSEDDAGVIDGLDIDELLTDVEAGSADATDELAADEDIDALLNGVSEESSPSDDIANIDDIDALLDGAADEAGAEDEVADIDDIDALLDGAAGETAADDVADIDDIDALLDGAAGENAADDVADIDDIDALLDGAAGETAADDVEDIDDIDALLDGAANEVNAADEVADIDDIDALLDGAADEVVAADDVADIDDIDALLDGAADETVAADDVADIDDINALLDGAADEAVAADDVAEIDDIDALLDGAEEVAATEGDLGDIDTLFNETDGVEAGSEAAALGDSELEALFDEATEEVVDVASQAGELDAITDLDLDMDLEMVEEEASPVDAADDLSASAEQPEAAIDDELDALLNDIESDDGVAELAEESVDAADGGFDALLAEAAEPQPDALEAMLDEVTQEAESELAAELGLDEFDASEDVGTDEVAGAPDPGFGVADDVVEEIEVDDDADALLDQLMSEVEDVVELPEAASDVMDDADSVADLMPEKDAAEADLDALMGLDEQLAEQAPQDERSPGERAEEDMADLIASDLGDLEDLLNDDPLADSSVASADTSGLDDMLERMAEQAEEVDVLDSETGEAPAEDVLAEVELDATDLDADLDDMLASLEQDIATEGGDDLASLEAGVVPETTGEDLEAQIDGELEALLSGVDQDIELEEVSAVEEEPDLGSEMNLLDGVDEVETKLDLARAYIEMEDLDGARDILNEVKQEGSDRQSIEADRLLSEMPA